MQEEPDDGCGVDEQVVLEVDGATVAVLPDVLRVAAGQRALTRVVAELLRPPQHDNMGNACD